MCKYMIINYVFTNNIYFKYKYYVIFKDIWFGVSSDFLL